MIAYSMEYFFKITVLMSIEVNSLISIFYIPINRMTNKTCFKMITLILLIYDTHIKICTEAGHL